MQIIKSITRITTVIFFLSIVLLLIGCDNDISEPMVEKESSTSTTPLINENLTTPTVSSIPSSTFTVVPTPPTLMVSTLVISPTFTVVPTSPTLITSTQVPELPSNHDTPLDPSTTPLPTIPVSQRGVAYAELMQTNGNCQLPCWWGFELGKATLLEVKQFYETFDASIYESEGDNGRVYLDIKLIDSQIENGQQIQHSFIAQDGIIIEAIVDAGSFYYSITGILEQLGKPSNVWIWAIPEPWQGILPTRSRFYFPSQGVLALYATGGERIEEHINICYRTSGGTSFMLWDVETWDPNGDKDIFERVGSSTQFEIEGYPISEVSNWDIQKLHDVLTDPTRFECLETPAELWSPPY